MHYEVAEVSAALTRKGVQIEGRTCYVSRPLGIKSLGKLDFLKGCGAKVVAGKAPKKAKKFPGKKKKVVKH